MRNDFVLGLTYPSGVGTVVVPCIVTVVVRTVVVDSTIVCVGKVTVDVVVEYAVSVNVSVI